LSSLQLRFWGVRGSIATACRGNLGFGGNTACVEVRGPSGEILIVDAGTGIRNLGNLLMAEFAGRDLSLHLLLTHFHWDHIQGLPFFIPLYVRNTHVTFWSGFPVDVVQQSLEGQMAHPYFPVPFSTLEARRESQRIDGAGVSIGSVKVKICPLNHPQGAWAFRFECGGKVLVHASDYEHGDAAMDRGLREFARGADVLVYDSQFTPEEYDHHRGWGHSTWLEAAKVARDAGVGRLMLFHHHPDRTDAALEDIVQQTRAEFANAEAAREGMSIEV
jgi:phosphoribosyl 1,2-cyclic phosphodiesterase